MGDPCCQEERVGFDNQLGAVERTLQAKIKDYEELVLLSGDANHAREARPRSQLVYYDSRCCTCTMIRGPGAVQRVDGAATCDNATYHE